MQRRDYLQEKSAISSAAVDQAKPPVVPHRSPGGAQQRFPQHLAQTLL